MIDAPNGTASHGETFAASSLFSVTDPMGASITQYVLWDNGSGGAGILVNGVALPDKQNIDLTPAQLAQTTYQSGSGADVVWVDAFDGTAWSAWTSFQVTAPVDSGPVEAVTYLSSTHGQSFAGSSLFAYSDPFNSAATEYDVWNKGTGGGQFLLNGTPLLVNQDNIITPAELPELSYVAGTGTDTLWMRADDGTVWGAWSLAFTVATPPPTVSASSDAMAIGGQTIALSSLVTIADPGNAGYQMLQLWDSNGTVAGGEFLINGMAQTAGHAINVPTGANVVFGAGTGSGTDTLWAQLVSNGTATGWEKFTVSVPAPTLSVTSRPSVTAGAQIALSSLVTVSDPSNATYELQLWDSDGTVAGGEFLINGMPQTAGHAINVAAGANVVFDAGTSAGTDTLWAQIVQSNGTATGWDKFTVTVPNPTVMVQNDSTVTPGQTIALSNLVTILDPGNVGYRKLQLWDSDGTAATGQFMVNGAPQTGGHTINVAPGDVANTVFDEGTTGSTDALWAQLSLNNGTTTGWEKFTVTDPVHIAQGATLEVTNPYAGQAIFAGNSGTLQLDQSAAFSGTVAGMTGADTLDLRDIGFGGSTALRYTANSANTGGTLNVSDGARSANIALLGQYSASSFATTSDGHGATSIELQTAPLSMLAQTQHA